MSDEETLSLISSFKELPDPRVEGRCDHLLIDIIVVAVCGVIAGAQSWVDIESFGKAKQEWLSTFLELPNGIPIVSTEEFEQGLRILEARSTHPHRQHTNFYLLQGRIYLQKTQGKQFKLTCSTPNASRKGGGTPYLLYPQ